MGLFERYDSITDINKRNQVIKITMTITTSAFHNTRLHALFQNLSLSLFDIIYLPAFASAAVLLGGTYTKMQLANADFLASAGTMPSAW